MLVFNIIYNTNTNQIIMDKNSKNLLQEHFQKAKSRLPIYSPPIRIDPGIDNAPIWKSTVTLDDDRIFDGIAESKKGAEIIAADHAYNYINQKQVKFTKQSNQNNQTIYQKVKDISEIEIKNYKLVLLVDGENSDFDIKKLSNDILILIFASKNTSKKLIFQFQNDYANCYVFISECVGRDAADHLLTFYAGKLSILYNNMQYYVLTKDHYGEFLEKFMNKCKYICSIDEIF
jgi:Double-stranded RNA binding motif